MVLIFSIFELILIVFIIGYLLNWYASKDVPLYVKILCFLSWLTSFGIVFIIPLDIYFTLHSNAEKNQEQIINNNEYKILEKAWIIIYWMNQILTWIVLPIFQPYEEAGEFTWQGKLKRAIMFNIIYYAVIGALLVFIVIYLSYSGKVSGNEMIMFLMGMGNWICIFVLVILLGHGLVAIPKHYWRIKEDEEELKYLQSLSAKTYESKVKEEADLESYVRMIFLLSQKPENSAFSQFFTSILDKIPEEIKETSINNIPQQIGDTVSIRIIKHIDLNQIISINKQLIKNIHTVKRLQTKWERLLDEAFLLEDIIENQSSLDFKIRSTFWVQRNGELGSLIDKLIWLWHIKIKKFMMFIMGIICPLISLITLISEISIFADLDINILNHIITDQEGFIVTQIVTLIPLSYIVLCVNYSIFNITIAGDYKFQQDQQTDAPSLLFGSINFARVSGPLCFNFLQIIAVPNSAYEKVMGSFEIDTMMGNTHTFIFPLTLVLLSICNCFDLYKRILSFFGLRELVFQENPQLDKLEEGKKLLYKARIERERKYLSLKSTQLNDYDHYKIKSSKELSAYDNFYENQPFNQKKLKKCQNQVCDQKKSSLEDFYKL